MLVELNYTVSHTYREGNSAADWLARWGTREGDAEWSQLSDVPLPLRGLIRVDKWGLPSIRSKGPVM